MLIHFCWSVKIDRILISCLIASAFCTLYFLWLNWLHDVLSGLKPKRKDRQLEILFALNQWTDGCPTWLLLVRKTKSKLSNTTATFEPFFVAWPNQIKIESEKEICPRLHLRWFHNWDMQKIGNLPVNSLQPATVYVGRNKNEDGKRNRIEIFSLIHSFLQWDRLWWQWHGSTLKSSHIFYYVSSFACHFKWKQIVHVISR